MSDRVSFEEIAAVCGYEGAALGVEGRAVTLGLTVVYDYAGRPGVTIGTDPSKGDAARLVAHVRAHGLMSREQWHSGGSESGTIGGQLIRDKTGKIVPSISRPGEPEPKWVE